MKELILTILFLAGLVGGTTFIVLRLTRVSKIKGAVAATVTLSLLASIWYFLYAFSLAFEDHYDVKRGTLLWYMTMDNATISDFPITKSVSKPVFNKIGGDAPGVAAGWEVEYVSAATYSEVTQSINHFLSNRGYRMKQVNKPECAGWRGLKQISTTRFFSAQNGSEECLDLRLDVFENTVIVKVTLLI